jgi:hypothetical protein
MLPHGLTVEPNAGSSEWLFGVSFTEPSEVQFDPVAVDDDYDARGIGTSSGQIVVQSG